MNIIRFNHIYKVPITYKNLGINTLVDGKESPMSNLLFNILSSLSEFQYHLTLEKKMDGINRAKLSGKYKGRKLGSVKPMEKFLKKPKVKKVKIMLDEGMTIRKICSIVECSQNNIYKVQETIKSL